MISKRGVVAAAAMLVWMSGALSTHAQDATRVQPQATAEDVLAAVVHHSAVIFAGEVYAVRVPAEIKAGTGVSGGLPSARADAVQVEFRVDVGIRGASIGSNYVLHMPLAAWQQGAPFTLHQRAMVFFRPPDSSGLSGPVEGESDLPGMDLGVMPVDDSNQIDLSRLQRLVTKKIITTASMLPPPGPAQVPSVSDVTTTQGRDTLIAGSNQGKMPELRNSKVPFLALVRDVTVLSAAEGRQGNAAAQ
jgi:hypothetical protein